MLRYTVLRLLLFVAMWGVLILAGVPGIWSLVFAALFSMVTSLFLLRGPREEAARGLEERFTARREAREQRAAAQRVDEDEEDRETGLR